MGQKVSPKAFRLKFNQYWDSLWFSDKQYGKQLIEDVKIRQMISEKLKIASVAKVIIDRNANQITVSIYSSKPGVLIGRSGAGSEKIKEMLEKITESKVRLNIVEIKKSDINAMNVAQNVAAQLEKRIPFRRAIKQTIDQARESGTRGIKVQVSGRLNGADIARSEKAAFGTVPLSTLKSNVDYAHTTALTTYGIIGIKVWVYLGKKDHLFKDDKQS
jgi:small subunit ribosomal protein S3